MDKTVRELIEKRKAEVAGTFTPDEIESTVAPSVVKEDPMILESEIPVLKNKIKYSDIAGEPHPIYGDVEYPKPPKFKNTDSIPKADPNWVPDHKTLPDTIASILYKHNALVVGPPGTGKTKDIQEICARVKIPYYRVNGMDGMEFCDLVGTVHLVDGDTKFMDGPIVEPIESGGVLAVDEPFKMPAGTLMGLQAVAEEGNNNRYVLRAGHEDESKVKLFAHPEFRLILCDNVRGTGDDAGRMAATQTQDQSFINRMTYKILKNYMEPKTEQKAICTAYPWISEKLAHRMVQLANLMRKAWEQGSVELPFSFRELQGWSSAISELRDIRRALDVVYTNLLTEDGEREILNKAYDDVFEK